MTPMRGLVGAVKIFAVSALLSPASPGASAPWEPEIRWSGNGLEIRRVRSAETVRETVEILETEKCRASATPNAVRWEGPCEFLHGAYIATLRAPKDGGTVRVAFPFSLHARGEARTLLLDAPELVD
jgi:hypothetical protein